MDSKRVKAGPAALVRNDIVCRGAERHRILAIRSTAVFVIKLGDDGAWPIGWELPAVMADLGEGLLSRVDDDAPAMASELASKAAVELRAKRWQWIQGLVFNPEVLRKDGRGKLIATHCKSVNASPQTVSTCLRLFWQGGQTTDALLPDFHRCGAVPQSAEKAETVEGVRNTRGGLTSRDHPKFMPTNEEIERMVQRARELFFVSKAVTRRKLYRTILKEFYSYQDGDGKLKLLPLGESPTRRQFNYAFNKTLSLSEKIKRDKSDAEFDNDHAPKLGSVFDVCVCVGHVYEIDSTIVDLWLVARDNRHRIIGKATLYLIIDRFSRLIVGFHLSLDKPSWANAMEAILTLVEDKKLLCARWGATYRPETWPAHGYLPAYIMADRGTELTGMGSDQLVDGVQCNLINAPSQRSARKGTVECAFKLVHVQIKDQVAGYDVPGDAFKRQGEHYERDAQYTLDELAAEFIDIIHLHNHRVHPGLRIDSHDFLDGHRPIPVEIWKRDFERSAGCLSRMTPTYLRTKLLPRGTAVVTQNGIEINHCRYSCKRADAEEWFVQASIKRFKVSVSFDRRLVDEIHIHHPTDPKAPAEVASLTSASEHHKGLSVAEVQAIELARKRAPSEAERYNIELELEYEKESDRRSEAAFEATQTAVHAAEGGARADKGRVERSAEARARRAPSKPKPAKPTTPAKPKAETASPARDMPQNIDDLMGALFDMDPR